jgi:hypothetical protein
MWLQYDTRGCTVAGVYYDKSNLIADGVAAGTGIKAYRDGATGWEAASIGLWWRWWYKNLTFSLFILGVFTVYVLGYTMNDKPLPLPLALLATAEVLTMLWVFSITYVSLVDVSGFKQRLWYRLWAPVQHRLVPNVARFWWYLMILFPMWITVWYIAFWVNKTGIQPSNNLPPEWSR